MPHVITYTPEGVPVSHSPTCRCVDPRCPNAPQPQEIVELRLIVEAGNQQEARAIVSQWFMDQLTGLSVRLPLTILDGFLKEQQ